MTRAASTSLPKERLLDPHVLARLRGLELRAKSVVEGYVSGLHRSPFRGFSTEFASMKMKTS